MKKLTFILIIIISSCNSTGEKKESSKKDSILSEPINAGVDTSARQTRTPSIKAETNKNNDEPVEPPRVYANQRFRDVTVLKIGENKFRISGKGQIFEASFGWVIEDGHNELKKGFEMTDAGAPEWGNFSFIVEISKKRTNSTLHLILFETSAKDGSRQHELPIKLPFEAEK